MSRFIDADKLVAWCMETLQVQSTVSGKAYVRALLDAVDSCHTADAVEVVRCAECKHYGGVTFGYVCRKYSGAETKVCTEKDHYCSYGERREQSQSLNRKETRHDKD